MDKNWAVDWQNSHAEGEDWWELYAAHSQPLNGNRKGYAAWWLWARLAGWNECTADYNQDADVDGNDISQFISEFSSYCLEDISSQFGE